MLSKYSLIAQNLAWMILLLTLSLLGTRGTASEDDVFFEKEYQLSFDNDYDGPLGTVFDWSTKDLRCSAGYIYSIQNRTYVNQNHLEFWCRNKSLSMELQLVALGKAYDGQVSSRLANINGYLFDYVSQKFFDFDLSVWSALFNTRGVIGGGYVVAAQSDGQQSYVFATNYNNCPGLSVFSKKGYLGSINFDGWSNYSALFASTRRLAVNADYKIFVSDMSSVQVRDECYSLEMEAVAISREEPIYTYGLFPTAQGLLFEGHDSASGCSHVYLLDEKGERTEFKSNVQEGQCISDYYSYTIYKDEILMGAAPGGQILSLSLDNMSVTDRRDKILRRDNRFDYLEKETNQLRSITYSSGMIFFGVSPWGEIGYYDSNSDKLAMNRLFSAPEKSTSRLAPYSDEMYQSAVILLQAKGYSMGAMMNGYQTLLDDQGSFLKAMKVDPLFWSQQISSIAVVNGGICMSTSNLTGDYYSEEVHGNIEPSAIEEYGETYCGTIDNQVLATAPTLSEDLAVKFVVSKLYMSIYYNGSLVARSRHNFSIEELKLLSQNGELRTGGGDYGALKGLIKAG